MSDNKPLILVDGSSYLFRAFHGMPNLMNQEGMPTGAIYGVVNMLKSLIKTYDPSHMAVIFDAKGPTFRNEMYDEYKANRPPMPDDLRVQIEPLHQIIEALGLPLLCIPGVEADDVIGTFAEMATSQQLETIISTGDKDMAQLVSDHVTLINTMTSTHMTLDGVVEKFGVRADQIIDYLALMGDKVDNIPGVPKCGPKTAVKWLTEFETMENLMVNADKIGGKIGEHLRGSLDQLPLSKQLATIKLDVELDYTLEQLDVKPENKDALTELFLKYGFTTWLKQVTDGKDIKTNKVTSTAVQVDRSHYQTIHTQEELSTWLDKVAKSERFAFDLETTSLDYIEARIVGIAMAIENEAVYIPTGHDYLGAPEQLHLKDVLIQLEPLLNPADGINKVIGQNLKYDSNVLANYDMTIKGIAADTMLQSYILNSNATRHDMDSLASYYLNHSTIHFEDIAGKGKKQMTFNQIEVEQASEYAAEDADVTLKLYQVLNTKLAETPRLQEVVESIEIPAMKALAKMERTGVLINPKLLSDQSQKLGQRLEQLQTEVWELAGETFNLGSPKQLQTILFEKMELPIIKKTPKGQPSTAEEVLVELAESYELPKLLLEYRSLSKLKSTYTDKLPLQINPTTGRVHTSYHQAVAATGRLSSTDPNLQNIPIRNEEGRKIRQAFIAPPGHKIVAADYSQIELRIMAHLSQDAGLLDAFNHGKDIHTATAAEVFDVPVDEVSHEQRRRAKATNFGLIYGMSAFGLAKQLGVERGEAQHYIHTYFARYPGVEQFMDSIRAQAAEDGYVETIWGRRLYLPEINASNGMRRKAAERTAINAPMQGSAADIIKKAMNAVHDWIESTQPPVTMIMQVHDELVFEVRDDFVEEAQQKIIQIMQDVAELSVPLVVEAGVGDNWDEAH
jgi:DNA polymerase I